MIIQLYIEGQRVELFKDESVTITDSIQNVKDIEKVFTAFSKSFSIPASKVNNKIFKHYYNFDIVGGFDARKKVPATIELNSIPFKTGKIKLEGVDLKNNKPNIYRVVFFGDIVDLKDKLGEKKLSDLKLEQYDLDYNAATVKTKLETPKSSTDVIVPLITHSQRLYFDINSHDEAGDGNLYYDTGHTQNQHGVKWNELKYAIRVNKIIEAIEDTFDLQFSSDFFKNTNIPEFNDLFLWLHRKSGEVLNSSGNKKIETRVNEWVYTEDFPYKIDEGYFDIYSDTQYITSLSLFLDPLNDSTEYDIRIDFNGEKVFSSVNNTGNTTITGGTDFDISGNGYYEVYITTEGAMDFTNVRWSSTYVEGSESESINYNTGTFITSSTFVFEVSKQIPDMKILEFLTGLFKLFNLTAYVVNDVIQVKPLDDFFENPNTYDITEFIDVNSSKVDVALPYKEVVFRFKDTKTFLADRYREISNKAWGESYYNDNNKDLDGGLYKVEAPFSKMMFENIITVLPLDTKQIQWGYSVDKSQNAYKGSPLLFYPITGNVYDGDTETGISFVNVVNAENVATSHVELPQWVNQPFNSPSLGSPFFQLSFFNEASEFSGSTDYSNTLFTEYYQEYITSVFNLKQRLTKVKAYLPMKILLNYSLGDRFVIAGNQYKINSISTNLQTGESNLELINDL